MRTKQVFSSRSIAEETMAMYCCCVFTTSIAIVRFSASAPLSFPPVHKYKSAIRHGQNSNVRDSSSVKTFDGAIYHCILVYSFFLVSYPSALIPKVCPSQVINARSVDGQQTITGRGSSILTQRTHVLYIKMDIPPLVLSKHRGSRALQECRLARREVPSSATSHP